MFLKELKKNRLLTIIYSHNGLLKTCRGKVYELNYYNQTINILSEEQNAMSIRLSSIKEIHQYSKVSIRVIKQNGLEEKEQ